MNKLHASVCHLEHGGHINVDDAAATQTCLAHSLIKAIKKTIENATQCALMMVATPDAHALDLSKQIDKPASTNDFKRNATSCGGCNFVHIINVHEMKQQKHFVHVHQVFLCEEGVPSVL